MDCRSAASSRSFDVACLVREPARPPRCVVACTLHPRPLCPCFHQAAASASRHLWSLTIPYSLESGARARVRSMGSIQQPLHHLFWRRRELEGGWDGYPATQHRMSTTPRPLRPALGKRARLIRPLPRRESTVGRCQWCAYSSGSRPRRPRESGDHSVVPGDSQAPFAHPRRIHVGSLWVDALRRVGEIVSCGSLIVSTWPSRTSDRKTESIADGNLVDFGYSSEPPLQIGPLEVQGLANPR